MRGKLAVAAVAMSLVACGEQHAAPMPVDLSTSLAAARTELDAHVGESRFLALLSPT